MADFNMVSACIAYTSAYVITISKKDDLEFSVQLFSLTSYECVFRERVGIKLGQGETESTDPADDQTYIKIMEIMQNDDGNIFAYVYFDNGLFRLRTFTAAEIELALSMQEFANTEIKK